MNYSNTRGQDYLTFVYFCFYKLTVKHCDSFVGKIGVRGSAHCSLLSSWRRSPLGCQPAPYSVVPGPTVPPNTSHTKTSEYLSSFKISSFVITSNSLCSSCSHLMLLKSDALTESLNKLYKHVPYNSQDAQAAGWRNNRPQNSQQCRRLTTCLGQLTAVTLGSRLGVISSGYTSPIVTKEKIGLAKCSGKVRFGFSWLRIAS